jgi:transmembrane sensor
MTVTPGLDEPPDWDAIARHRSGESGDDEARRVAAWLEAHPQDAEMLAALDRVIEARTPAAASGAGEPDVEAALRAVRARMHEARGPRVLPFPGARQDLARRRSTRWILGGVAAAAAIGALAVGLLRTRGGDGLPRAVAAGSMVATAVGARDSVRLPDGTRVVLGPGSRLSVTPGFGSAGREVGVEGMAYFVVGHESAPFIVHAGPALVRDIGTAFVVRTDSAAGVRSVTVAVTEGLVELDPDDASASSVRLKAGERGIVHSDGRVAAGATATDADLAWTRGRLIFTDAPLSAVRGDLLRWYGVELRVADSALLARRVTATFEREPVDSVLRVIALALGGSVDRRDSVAVLRIGAPR